MGGGTWGGQANFLGSGGGDPPSPSPPPLGETLVFEGQGPVFAFLAIKCPIGVQSTNSPLFCLKFIPDKMCPAPPSCCPTPL